MIAHQWRWWTHLWGTLFTDTRPLFLDLMMICFSKKVENASLYAYTCICFTNADNNLRILYTLYNIDQPQLFLKAHLLVLLLKQNLHKWIVNNCKCRHLVKIYVWLVIAFIIVLLNDVVLATLLKGYKRTLKNYGTFSVTQWLLTTNVGSLLLYP